MFRSGSSEGTVVQVATGTQALAFSTVSRTATALRQSQRLCGSFFLVCNISRLSVSHFMIPTGPLGGYWELGTAEKKGARSNEGNTAGYWLGYALCGCVTAKFGGDLRIKNYPLTPPFFWVVITVW